MIPALLVVDFLVEIESTVAARSQVLTGLHLNLWLTTCSVAMLEIPFQPGMLATQDYVQRMFTPEHHQ